MLLVALPIVAPAQDRLVPERGDLVLKFAPASLLNPQLSTLDIAAAYYLTDQYAIEIKYGKEVTAVNRETEATRYDGYKIFCDVQRVVSQKISVGVEVGMSSNREAWRLHYLNADLESMEDDYETRKIRYSVTPKMTMVFVRTGRFLFEGFAGIGVKRLDKSVLNLEFDEAKGDRDHTKYSSPLGAGANHIPLQKTDVRVSLGISLAVLIKSF